jgi:hypothetical protein
MTVWICINTAKEIGDVDHLKVFWRPKPKSLKSRALGLVSQP